MRGTLELLNEALMDVHRSEAVLCLSWRGQRLCLTAHPRVQLEEQGRGQTEAHHLHTPTRHSQTRREV